MSVRDVQPPGEALCDSWHAVAYDECSLPSSHDGPCKYDRLAAVFAPETVQPPAVAAPESGRAYESRVYTHLWIREFVGDHAYAHGLADDVFDLRADLVASEQARDRWKAWHDEKCEQLEAAEQALKVTRGALATLGAAMKAESAHVRWLIDKLEAAEADLAASEQARDDAWAAARRSAQDAVDYEGERDRAVQALSEAREALVRAVYLGEHLQAMIPRSVWRDSGGDDGQGHYEGGYHAEQVAIELRALAAVGGAHQPGEEQT